MNPSMINAATTMHGLQRKLDMLSNNIANMNTVGYKRQDATFQDVLTDSIKQHPAQLQPGRISPFGMTEAWGARLSQVQHDFRQGVLQETNQPTDVAIEGNGLFEIGVLRLTVDGQPLLDENDEPVFDRVWTRNGAFKLTTRPDDADNAYLTTEHGYLIAGISGEPIAIPKTHEMHIDVNGAVFIRDSRFDDALPQQIDQLRIVHVLRPQALVNIGHHLYGLSNDHDNIDEIVQLTVAPEEAGITIRQGYLEQANVNIADEMAELIQIQRAYQLNARAITSSDTMMGIANQLRG